MAQTPFHGRFHGPWPHRAAAWLSLLLCAALLGCATPPPTDGTAIAPGLLQRTLPTPPGVVLHVLQVDLTEPRLRLQLSGPALKGQTLDQMAAAVGALASVNASFFDRNFNARGWTVSDGQAWADVMAVATSPLLACDLAQRCKVVFEPGRAPATTWHTAVAGTPWLLRQGQARTAADDATCANLCAATHPRTAVGLDRTQRWLTVVLAEGRRPGVPGITLTELALWMQRLGVFDAINLDGGGSSALWLNGENAMQRPANEPAQRRISNALHVVPGVPNDAPHLPQTTD